VKKSLESRIRGWFPQEPILRRDLTSSSWNAQNDTLPTDKEFESLRSKYKKIYVLIAAGLLSGMMLFFYFMHNRLINSDLAGASLMTILAAMIFNIIALDISVKRKTVMRHTIDKKVLPVIAFSVIVIICLWTTAAVNLIGFYTIIEPVPLIGFSAFVYYFAVEYFTKEKNTQLKHTTNSELRS
jgi:hypothetical protein